MDDLTYEELYRKFWLYLVRRIYYKFPMFTWQDAEDVAQDALLAAWQQRESYDPARSQLVTWLMTIAFWYGRTVFNYKRKWNFCGPEDFTDDTAGPEQTAINRERIERLERRIDHLFTADRTRELLARIAMGYSVREAGEQVGVTMSAAQARLKYVRDTS